MARRAKLKSKDTAALEEFLHKVPAALGDNLFELKLFGSKATGRDQQDSRHRCARRRESERRGDRGSGSGRCF